MFLGIDIGGTNLKSAVVDLAGNIIFKDSTKTNTSDFKVFCKDLIDIFNRYKTEEYHIEVVGIGVPGVVNKEGTIIVSPNLPNLEGRNLKKEFSEYTNLSIFIDNDANTAAVAELVAGNGAVYDDFLYVTLGTGIGGAIIYNREIVKGSIGGAGEIGHTIICCERPLEIDSFRIGTLESLAGKNQIVERMKKILNQKNLQHNADFDVKDISSLADGGDENAIRCLMDTGYYIGTGIASAMNLLDIHVVIFGGGISESSEILFQSIESTIEARTLPSISERVKILKAYFRKDTGVIGAALFASQMVRRKQDE